MTAYELVLYVSGAARRTTTHAWLTARFALEGMSKHGLRSLDRVLKPYDGETDPNFYDEDAALEKLKAFVSHHNAWWKANHGV